MKVRLELTLFWWKPHCFSCLNSWEQHHSHTTRYHSWSERKLEYPEKTVGWERFKLKSSPHTNVCWYGDWYHAVRPYASSIPQGYFIPHGHPSRYQPHHTRLNFGENTGTGVSLFCPCSPYKYSWFGLFYTWPHSRHIISLHLIIAQFINIACLALIFADTLGP